MKTNYTFAQFHRFIDFDMLPLAISWAFSGFIIYIAISRPSDMITTIMGLLVAALFIFHPLVFRNTYYRWISYKYNQQTSISIDTTQKIFTYKHDYITITFTPDDIKKWWIYYRDIIPSTFCCDVIEIHLKNGKNIVMTSELECTEELINSDGSKDVVHFVDENWKDLGLPKEYQVSRHEKSISFHTYLREIAD